MRYRSKRSFLNIYFLIFIGIFSYFLNAQDKLQEEVNSYLKGLPFKSFSIDVPHFSDKTFNIKDYGAIGDGHTLNTEAFKKTIEACSKTGGGIVIVPQGFWLTGPIELKSNINFHVDRGALILFTPDHTQYPIIKSSKRGFIVASPVYGINLTNIAITGEGIFDGSGEAWRPLKKAKTTESLWKSFINSGGVLSNNGQMWWPSKEAMDGEEYLKDLLSTKTKNELTEEDFLKARDFKRPILILLMDCKNVLIDGPTFEDSPAFALYPNWCDNVIVRNVKIHNEYWAQNGDGIDISSCKNVLVYKCRVNAGDDGICMKSSKDKKSNEPSLQNIVIADNVVYHAHGGFVTGSNTDGGMHNIYVSNCDFIGSDVGLRFKSARDRGGLVDNIFIKNIYMKNILNEAILFDTHYENRGFGSESNVPDVNERTPRFENIYLENIYCNGAKQAVLVDGLPEMPIQKIKISNSYISADEGFESMYAKEFDLENVKIVPKNKDVYSLNQSSDFKIVNGFCPEGTLIFMKVNGNRTSNINLINTSLSSAKTPIKYGQNVNINVVIQK